ncbi:MAG TPA: tRNA (adenosine(37)-N6)-threonylcarbamoyltransferase complex ATPase subunit type 1 TsaE [Cyclobacteriaceae bacterium]|jgi:tRNA threonylcarbamoyladenosine biosynthesis protein TsaE|nr:tRNA (adenosine(37)-N6)-threonylcarbamoyltransferase complex ATPase subunit type 1 TsaE [Cyclobacteriaceae bacterium]
MSEVVSADQEIVFLQNEIREVAKKLIKAGSGFSVWALHGEMGAGKTTLVKALVATLGVHETTASPTFSIVNEYHGKNSSPIYHFDFYRIKNESEAFDIGTDEYFDSGNLCLIEWPEKISTLLPSTHFEIQLEIIDEQTRLIRYRKHA